MKRNSVVVIGGGIVGVTTAHALWKRGYEVTVLDELEGAGMGTSFANAGELSFGYSGPWATPGLLQKIPGMLTTQNGPLRIHLDMSSASAFLYQLRWLRWFGMNTKVSRFERNKRRIVELSARSKAVFRELIADTGVQFDFQEKGTLQLFRTKAQLEAVVGSDVESLRQAGVRFEIADPSRCVEQEPALARIATGIAGGIVFHDDATGDCFGLTQQLVNYLRQHGVVFEFKAKVEKIDADAQGVRGIETRSGRRISASLVVLACGPWTRQLARPLGLSVPIYPVRGYSLTAPITDLANAPVSTILDETTKIAITRLGDRVRVGGTAEIAGFHRPDSIVRRNLLRTTLTELFPCAELGFGAQTRNWTGFRPMTPDGTPIIGATVVPGLFLNAGHGTLGFTQSAASAELCANVISGELPSVDPADYALERYGKQAQQSGWYQPPPPSAVETVGG